MMSKSNYIIIMLLLLMYALWNEFNEIFRQVIIIKFSFNFTLFMKPFFSTTTTYDELKKNELFFVSHQIFMRKGERDDKQKKIV